jgi:hypothetical protein
VLTLLLALACSDPELDPVAEALSAWDEARAAADAGDLDGALGTVREARALDPGSPALAGWEAELLRQKGDAPGALSVLDAALRSVPDHAELREQRAWLRMAQGDARGAAEDLAPLVRAGLVDPEDLADDPTYAPLADDPATAWLVPPPRIGAELSSEAGAVLVGDTWVLDVLVDIRSGEPLTVAAGGPGGGAPLRLERVVDDRLSTDGKREQRRITWTFRATGAGTTVLGPWTLSTGRATATLGPVPVEVTALGDRTEAGVAWVPASLPVPLSLAPVDAALAPRTSAGRTVLPAPPGATVSLEAAPDPGVVHAEARVAGQPRWEGPLLPAGTRARAVVRSGARTLYEGTLP